MLNHLVQLNYCEDTQKQKQSNDKVNSTQKSYFVKIWRQKMNHY